MLTQLSFSGKPKLVVIFPGRDQRFQSTAAATAPQQWPLLLFDLIVVTAAITAQHNLGQPFLHFVNRSVLMADIFSQNLNVVVT